MARGVRAAAPRVAAGVRAVRSAERRCAGVHRVQRRHAARRHRLPALRAAGGAGRRCGACLATAAAVSRPSPPGVTLFRSIACCRRSSTARNWRFAEHVRPRTRRRRRARGKRRSRTASSRCRSRRRGSAHRGFNQAQEIARVVARGRACRCSPVCAASAIRRRRRRLPASARARNVRGAFAARRPSRRPPRRARRRRDDHRRHARGGGRRVARRGRRSRRSVGRRAHAAAVARAS